MTLFILIKEVVKFEINFNVIIDYPFPTERKIGFCIKNNEVYESKGLTDTLDYSDDALEVFKHVSKSNLKNTVCKLAPKESTWKCGIKIIRLYE